MMEMNNEQRNSKRILFSLDLNATGTHPTTNKNILSAAIFLKLILFRSENIVVALKTMWVKYEWNSLLVERRTNEPTSIAYIYTDRQPLCFSNIPIVNLKYKAI